VRKLKAVKVSQKEHTSTKECKMLTFGGNTLALVGVS
jgi:hypothetical protein